MIVDAFHPYIQEIPADGILENAYHVWGKGQASV
jgi:hypothetical protein